MKPATKRKHTVLSIEDKVKIINRLENGESGVSLAKIYNVGKATISDIKAKKNEILNFASHLSNTGSKRRKTMKKPNCEKLEEALYEWYIQMREEGEYVSGPLLCKKALELNQKFAGPPDFKASSGWLNNFKSRHGIKFESHGGTLPQDFIKKIKEEDGFSEDDVYQADETNLYWTRLPPKSIVSLHRTTSNFTASNQSIILMFCANASGQHILPLLIIGQDETPISLKGETSLPLEYKSQKNADMDADIFMDWFSGSFIPNVRSHRLNEGRTGKVLLLINDVPVRPSLEQLNTVDENFIVKVLPSDDAFSLQSMRYDVLQELNTMYKKHFLRQLEDKDEQGIIEFLKEFTITDCCCVLANVWTILSSGVAHEQNLDDDLLEIVNLFQSIPAFSECGQDDAMAWLYDYDLINEEVVTLIQGQKDADSRDGCDGEELEETATRPTHEEAFAAFETALAWCERQPELSASEILFLKRMRDLAATKKQYPMVYSKI